MTFSKGSTRCTNFRNNDFTGNHFRYEVWLAQTVKTDTINVMFQKVKIVRLAMEG